MIEHVIRPALPWDTAAMTECGHVPAEFAVVLYRDQLVGKVRGQGVQRAALSTCMTLFEHRAGLADLRSRSGTRGPE